MDDDFPDIPLENFGAETNVPTPPVEETKTAPDAPADGSDAPQDAQPADAEDNSKTEDKDETAPADNGKPQEVEDKTENTQRPEKKDRVQGRFNDMTKKLSDQGNTIQELEAKLAQYEVKNKVQPLQLDEQGNLTPEALQQNIAQQIAAQREADMAIQANREARNNEIQRFQSEEVKIANKWPELREPTADNPNPDFNQDMYDAVKEAIELAALPRVGDVKSLKEISPYNIAEKYMKGVESAAARASAQTQQNLSQLQADSADIPNDNSTTKVDPNSLEALEARLADVKF